MLTKIARIIAIFALLFYLFKWLFLWLFETTDSYFYWAFAEFLRTGKYFAPHPYYWTVPTTFAAPFYSFFLYFARLTTPVRTEILIHLVQNLLIIASAFIIYNILKSFISKNIALVISALFLLVPANIFISSGLIPEPFAIFTISIFSYLSFQILTGKKTGLLKYLFLFTSLSILVRYNFISFFFLAGLLLFFKKISLFPKKAYFCNLLFFAAGLLVITSWAFVNLKLTGTIGLSDQAGKNLYNRVLGGDKLTPDPNNPNWQKLQQITKGQIDLFQPTYVIEPYISSYFGNRVAEESQFLSSIAISAIQKHPFEYLKNTFVNFFIIHGNGLPYSTDLYSFGWLGRTCRTLDTITICRPVIEIKYAANIWNSLVWRAESYYATVPIFINFILFFPSLIYALYQKKPFFRFLGIGYLLSAITVVIPEVPVFRYIYPLLPIQIILITFFLRHIYCKMKRISPCMSLYNTPNE